MASSIAVRRIRRARRAAAVACVTAAMGVASASAARADGEAPEVEAGRAAFIHGIELARIGQWSDARDAFVRSRELRRHPVTTYNVAYAERALGHLTRARRYFADALDEHAGGLGGTLPDDLVAAAKRYLDDLDRQIVRQPLVVGRVGLRVSVDGRALMAGAHEGELVAGTADRAAADSVDATHVVLLVDPGQHVVEVTGPDGTGVLLHREAAAGAAPWYLDLPSVAARLPTAARPSPSAPPATPAPPGVRPAAFASLGVGATSLVGTAVTGVAYAVTLGELRAACGDDVCPSDRADDIATTNALGTATWITAAVGTVFVVAGASLLATFPGSGDGAGRMVDVRRRGALVRF